MKLAPPIPIVVLVVAGMMVVAPPGVLRGEDAEDAEAEAAGAGEGEGAAEVGSIRGCYAGSYAYGMGAGGTTVRTLAHLQHDRETGQLRGSMTEPRTTFGVAVDGMLHADFRGTVGREGEEIIVRFTKVYRHHDGAMIHYKGVYNPDDETVTGTWQLEGTGSEGGSFRWSHLALFL